MNRIENLRMKINIIDADLIKNLAERKKLVIKIGELKAKIGTQVLDPEREQTLMKLYKTLAERHNLDVIFIEDLFKLIHTYSRDLQK